MRRLAVDTNIVITWLGLQSKELQPKSKLLFDKLAAGELELVSPEFLLVELVNVLRWRCGLNKKGVAESVRLVMRSGIKFVQVGRNATDKIANLVFKHDLTAYDSLFLHVAEREKCKLVTSDPKLLEVKEWCVGLGEVDL